MHADNAKRPQLQAATQTGHIPPTQLVHGDLALRPVRAYQGSFLSRLHKRYQLEKEKARRAMNDAIPL